MEVPADLRYTQNHEWARLLDDTSVRIGITDFAQHALTDIVFVELPDPGVCLESGSSFAIVESTKSVSEIYAPISGEVTAINDEVVASPELLNSDPYGNGWLIELTPKVGASLDNLMDAASYLDHISG